MSRAQFGQWGIQLSNEDFAQAVAAVGVLGLDEERLEKESIKARVARLQQQRQDIAPISRYFIGKLQGGVTAAPPAATYLAAWKDLIGYWQATAKPTPHGPLLRLEISAMNAPARPGMVDAHWLLKVLLENRVASSAYLRQDKPDRPVTWEWPLRIGVLDGGNDLAANIAVLPWPDLIERVDLADGDAECDLLLLTGNLRDALGRILQRPYRLRADCIVLLNGAGVPLDRVPPLVAALRSETLSSAVCLVRVDEDSRAGWFIRLIEILSHDIPLDVALACAAETQEPKAFPILSTSRRLIQAACLTSYTARLSRQVRRMAPPESQKILIADSLDDTGDRFAMSAPDDLLTQAADELDHRVTRGTFKSEIGDARVVVNIRRSVEAHLGGRLAVPPVGLPENRPTDTDERRVNVVVSEVSEAIDTVAATRIVRQLVANSAYALQLFIGPSRDGAISAAEDFPSHKLPPSRDGHWLDIFFVPLVRAEAGRFHTPQQGRLFLPPSGDSTVCHLNFRTHGVSGTYRARILIAHENRVIQTLLLSSALKNSGPGIALDIESVVSPNFNPAVDGRPFDAAIVVNHSPVGQVGFITLVGSEVSFREPVGIEKLIDPVRELLSKEASFPEVHGSLDAPELLQLFDKLAQYGRSILKPMPPDLQGSIPEGARIQIVEARAGAWLPVEIFYGSRPPKPGKPLCPNARAALLREHGASHETCPHRDDPEHQCPLRFWGFRNVIERQPCLNAPNGADYTISVPQSGANRIDALRSALIGASAKVRAKDISEPGGLIETVGHFVQTARTVKDWNEWEQAVQQDSPSLLVLLPHSMEDPNNVGIPALEIGGALLTPAYMESSYVAGPATASPVVLLLGCSTQLTDVPFLNFVEAFKREKAALVIGTLATIRGRRTVAFVSALLDGLKSAAGSNRSFGEVFLETKRKMLAGGDGFVLSLTAYGDVGWRL